MEGEMQHVIQEDRIGISKTDPAFSMAKGGIQVVTPPSQRTTAIAPMANGVTDLDPHAYEGADVIPGEDRNASARRRLSRKIGKSMYTTDSKVRDAILAHNENNGRAVEGGTCEDLPYLEALVESMRNYQTRLLKSGNLGESQKRKLLNELMTVTEKRMTAANSDLVQTALSATQVQRKPSADWHILTGMVGHDEYYTYKSKTNFPNGEASKYGTVMVCNKEVKAVATVTKASTKAEKKKAAKKVAKGKPAVVKKEEPEEPAKEILAIYQNSHYLQNMLVYTGLECVHSIDFANQMLLRLQQKETECRIGLLESKCSALRDQLMDMEDDLFEFSEQHGKNSATKIGNGLVNFQLEGEIVRNPELLVNTLMGVSEQLKELLKAISQAMKDTKTATT